MAFKPPPSFSDKDKSKSQVASLERYERLLSLPVDSRPGVVRAGGVPFKAFQQVKQGVAERGWLLEKSVLIWKHWRVQNIDLLFCGSSDLSGSCYVANLQGSRR